LKNFWLERALEVVETEILLVKASGNTKAWFNKMPSRIPAIFPSNLLKTAEDYAPIVGYAVHLRISRFGIEGVLRAPRKYHRYKHYVIYDLKNHPGEPFWLVIHR
jgi:hypothetical protein